MKAILADRIKSDLECEKRHGVDNCGPTVGGFTPKCDKNGKNVRNFFVSFFPKILQVTSMRYNMAEEMGTDTAWILKLESILSRPDQLLNLSGI